MNFPTQHRPLQIARFASVLTTACCLAVAASAALAQPPGGAPVRDPEHTFQRDVWSWRKLKEQNIVMQRQDYSCGAAALATVVRYYWGDPIGENYFLDTIVAMLTPEELEDRVKNGLTLTDLRLAAVKRGYLGTIGRLSYDEMTASKVPLVVGITVRGFDHFVVFRGADGEFVYLADPIRGNIRVPAWQFVEQWQENAVLVVAKPGADVREWSPLAVTPEEKMMGVTNRNYVRRNGVPIPRFGLVPR